MTNIGANICSLSFADHFGIKFIKSREQVRMKNLLCSVTVLHIFCILLTNYILNELRVWVPLVRSLLEKIRILLSNKRLLF